MGTLKLVELFSLFIILFFSTGKDKELVIHNQQNRSIIIGWSADAKFEVVRQINGNEVVAIQLRGEYHYHYHHIE